MCPVSTLVVVYPGVPLEFHGSFPSDIARRGRRTAVQRAPALRGIGRVVEDVEAAGRGRKISTRLCL